jgi:hypothetical protein
MMASNLARRIRPKLQPAKADSAAVAEAVHEAVAEPTGPVAEAVAELAGAVAAVAAASASSAVSSTAWLYCSKADKIAWWRGPETGVGSPGATNCSSHLCTEAQSHSVSRCRGGYTGEVGSLSGGGSQGGCCELRCVQGWKVYVGGALVHWYMGTRVHGLKRDNYSGVCFVGAFRAVGAGVGRGVGSPGATCSSSHTCHYGQLILMQLHFTPQETS